MADFFNDLSKPPEEACIGSISLGAETDDWQEWQKLNKDTKKLHAKIGKLSTALIVAETRKIKIEDTSEHPKIVEIREDRKQKGFGWMRDLDHVTTPVPLGKEEKDGP